MSYCCMACCLKCRRAMYYNLQEHRWVHHDGWPGCHQDDPEATA